MLKDDKHPRPELIDFLKEHSIFISEKAECNFEYVDCTDYKERTEFDFHIIDDDIEVLFEIKYTENGFGKSHRTKINRVYREMLNKCQCLKSSNIKSEDFLNSYQLYRNGLRITDKSKYTIFVTAKGNTTTYKQLTAFMQNINESYKQNVIALYWEDLIGESHPLYEKYIAE